MPISETLKYLENSHDNNMIDEWNSNNFPIDIERQKNTTMLDILNYHTFMHAAIKSKSNDTIVSKNIKLLNLQIKLNIYLLLFNIEYIFFRMIKHRIHPV